MILHNIFQRTDDLGGYEIRSHHHWFQNVSLCVVQQLSLKFFDFFFY